MRFDDAGTLTVGAMLSSLDVRSTTMPPCDDPALQRCLPGKANPSLRRPSIAMTSPRNVDPSLRRPSIATTCPQNRDTFRASHPVTFPPRNTDQPQASHPAMIPPCYGRFPGWRGRCRSSRKHVDDRLGTDRVQTGEDDPARTAGGRRPSRSLRHDTQNNMCLCMFPRDANGRSQKAHKHGTRPWSRK